MPTSYGQSSTGQPLPPPVVQVDPKYAGTRFTGTPTPAPKSGSSTGEFSQTTYDQQVALNQKYGANLKTDGIMGPLTKAAIAKYDTTGAGATTDSGGTGITPVSTGNPVLNTYTSQTGNMPLAPTGNAALDAANQADYNNQAQIYQHTQMLQNTINSLTSGNIPYTSQQQTMMNIIQQQTSQAIQMTQMAGNSATAMIRYNLAKTGATQSSPAVAAGELAASSQAGAFAIQQASLSGTLALTNYESSIQSGDIQAARDSFDSWQTSQKDIEDSQQQMYQNTATYLTQQQNYNLAVLNEQINQQKISIALGQLGISQQNANTSAGTLQLNRDIAGSSTDTSSAFDQAVNSLFGSNLHGTTQKILPGESSDGSGNSNSFSVGGYTIQLPQ